MRLQEMILGKERIGLVRISHKVFTGAAHPGMTVAFRSA